MSDDVTRDAGDGGSPAPASAAEGLVRDPVTGLVTPPAVQMNARRIVAAGTALWFVAFLVQLPFYSWLGHHHHRIWLWTCLAGTILGVMGWSIMNRHRGMGRTI